MSMPIVDKKLTQTIAQTVPVPLGKYVIYWCPKTPGFGVLVTPNGSRSYVAERKLNGKTKRRTLGKAIGAKAISIDTARGLQITISSELQTGVDRSVVQREQRKADKKEAVTFAEALRQYVQGKRVGKAKRGLKARTKADYLGMIKPAGTSSKGVPFLDGHLVDLADKPIYKITAADIWKIYNRVHSRSERQGDYAMQVLRAVLGWHGVTVENSPLSPNTAGKDRILIHASEGDPMPIPPECLGAWWRAAVAKKGSVSADACRFMVLTGARPGEVYGSDTNAGLLVRDVNLFADQLTLLDTKNGKNHVVLLSTQALEIVKQHCTGKKPADKVFGVLDPGKTLAAINKKANVDLGVTPHKLRHTFASVADEVVSAYALKRMMNHAVLGDVTGNNYVKKSPGQLRDSWQKLADFIEDHAVIDL
ncbi:integrase family protein [Roseateles sp.]|uniref:tyrosine-type recombinase/integrase n=1 Tax=Roseateles sp. TaxID=1971397 RepID=UPI00286A123E|nr:integrase family protein [Roseateles sp.]